MTAMDVLDPLVVFWIISQIDGRLVVHGQQRRILRSEPQLQEKRAQDKRATVGCFLEAHDMAAEPYMKTQPVVECCLPAWGTPWPCTACPQHKVRLGEFAWSSTGARLPRTGTAQARPAQAGCLTWQRWRRQRAWGARRRRARACGEQTWAPRRAGRYQPCAVCNLTGSA
eukprot:5980932-Pleurochrysis_carterae.AAC.1